MFRVIVILLALFLDLAFGDPPNRFHPLMLMGQWLTFGKRLGLNNSLTMRSQFWFGTFWTLAGIGLFALPFGLIEKKQMPLLIPKLNLVTNKIRPFPLHLSTFILQPLFLKPVFAYRGLRQAVSQVAKALANEDLVEARRLLSCHLVSRDTDQLSEAEIAGAAIESLAENLTDSLAAPLLAYAGAGLPGAWAYRFVNTADAMWGYRTPEFEQLGKFPARLDDALNWLPARLAGWLLVGAAWLAREDAGNAVQTMLSQRHQTASPNAGWTMSAMAGALRVTLNKRGVYELAGGQAKLNAAAIERALRIADICVGLSVAMICLGLIAAKILVRGRWPKSGP
ncbi:MAG: cobalamin biosynthesis protein CobD [Anaerolineae bacterium]|nr:cobalamin biosynthesis protein CobD [Anaerolineae bacterium]